jgi:hypothetical protein
MYLYRGPKGQVDRCNFIDHAGKWLSMLNGAVCFVSDCHFKDCKLAASALQIARSCIFMRPRAEKLSA